MKKLETALAFLFLSLQLFSQNNDNSAEHIYGKVFTRVEQPARFPGGDISFKKYIERNINLAVISASLKETQQTATIKFIVDTAGLVSDVSLANTNSIDTTLAKEGVKLIRRGPKWQPAVQNGRNVVYRAFQTIEFPTIEEAKILLVKREAGQKKFLQK